MNIFDSQHPRARLIRRRGIAGRGPFDCKLSQLRHVQVGDAISDLDAEQAHAEQRPGGGAGIKAFKSVPGSWGSPCLNTRQFLSAIARNRSPP